MEYFPGLTTWEILQKIQEKLDVSQRSPEDFERRIFTTKKDFLKNVFRIPIKSRITQKGFRVDIGHSSDQEKEKSRLETALTT